MAALLDIMIDIESLDVTPNCVILTIGAVAFDPLGAGPTEQLELRPLIDEQSEKYNRTISEDTVRWWSQQSADAQHESLGDHDRISFTECMDKLHRFCWNRNRVWSHGATFDIVAMQTAWDMLGKKAPWPYYNARCTRTIFDLAGVSLKDSGYATKTTHKAVEDAIHQVYVLQAAYQKLKAAGVPV
tara:strand:+ start:823 stop:1380 length:558 start_codon:yes stop_codon:yes gene_type:complete